MNIPALLRMVTDAGFAVNVTESGPVLVKTRVGASMSDELKLSLTKNRNAVILYLSRCSACGRDTGNAENRERLKDAAFCERGESKESRDGHGVYHPEEPRCPFKR